VIALQVVAKNTLHKTTCRRYYQVNIDLINDNNLELVVATLHYLRGLMRITFLELFQSFLEENTEGFQAYKAHSDNYVCSLIPGTPSFQAQYTPGQQSPPFFLPLLVY
jgi:hypothetical protein